MKALIVEDDFTSRLVLKEILKEYGSVEEVFDGKEAVLSVRLAIETEDPYDLICLDIMMPNMDGKNALKKIRALEESKGITSTKGTKVIMTTALGDPKTVVEAFKGLCDSYLVKPIEKKALIEELRKLDLI